MKKIICILFLLCGIISCAHRPKITVIELPAKEEKIIITPVKQTLSVGEKLVYAVDWRGIYAGQIILHVKELVNFSNRQCYHIIAQARPNRFFRLFYNVKYIVETYIDKETNMPLRFYKKRTYGKDITEEDISFDYNNNVAAWKYTGVEGKTIKLSVNNVQDLLSSLYYFRLKSFILGEEYPLDIIYNGTAWKLNAKISSLELVKMYHEKVIKTYTVSLSSKLTKHITGEQKIKIYFSAKEKHTPLLFNFRTKIGPLNGVLKNIPQDEFGEGAKHSDK
jgi:hypothetical protein